MRKLLTITLLLLLAGCLKSVPSHNNQFEGLTYDRSYSNGLSEFEKRSYYNTSQGIYYLPYDVMASMSRPSDSEFRLYNELFFEDPERLGLIPSPYRASDPPIGITVSSDPEFVPMFGVSCATCHTSTITNDKKQAFLVDGSGSKFAIDRLIKQMVTSMVLTMADPIEFGKFYDRYKTRVKIAEYPESTYEFDLIIDTKTYNQLKHSLKDGSPYLIDQLSDFEEMTVLELGGVGVPTTLEYAVYPNKNDLDSRTKMFVYMAKRLTWFLKQAEYAKTDSRIAPSGLGRGDPWSSTKNMYADLFAHQPPENWPSVSSGAIDTPYIWKYDDAKWIFATGTTNSMIERNFAQAIALLSDFNPETYESTVTLRKLEMIQQFTRKFQPPVWPDHILGPIDHQNAAIGKAIFKQQCLGCHNPKRETFNGPGSIEYNYLDVGTDDAYYQAQMEGFYGKKFIDDVLTDVMHKVKMAAVENEGIVDLPALEIGRGNVVWRQPKGNRIVAKPLWGIWATAPYLHNGSILNLRELLIRPEYRLTAFHVGSIEYDAKNVGFKNEQTAYSSLFETNCGNCLGNSNTGHNYGTNLSDVEKDQLLEFLKTYTMSTQF